MKIKQKILSIALLALVSTQSFAELTLSPVSKDIVNKLDIKNIKLGMSPQQVNDILFEYNYFPNTYKYDDGKVNASNYVKVSDDYNQYTYINVLFNQKEEVIGVFLTTSFNEPIKEKEQFEKLLKDKYNLVNSVNLNPAYQNTTRIQYGVVNNVVVDNKNCYSLDEKKNSLYTKSFLSHENLGLDAYPIAKFGANVFSNSLIKNYFFNKQKNYNYISEIYNKDCDFQAGYTTDIRENKLKGYFIYIYSPKNEAFIENKEIKTKIEL